MPSLRSADYWIRALRLQKHPEGGHFREVYRASESIPRSGLPARFAGGRSFSTAIFFILSAGEFSAFHRLQADEIWHYHCGVSLAVHEITPGGELKEHRLGPHPEKGDSFLAVVCAGSWIAASLQRGSGYVLAGCTVAPGFEFADFELARRQELIRLYPAHKRLIEKWTRP
jgi:predicted cupin superfamily sugar epimerase